MTSVFGVAHGAVPATLVCAAQTGCMQSRQKPIQHECVLNAMMVHMRRHNDASADLPRGWSGVGSTELVKQDKTTWPVHMQNECSVLGNTSNDVAVN